MIGRAIPTPTPTEAKLCRKSCSRNGGLPSPPSRPASSRMRCHCLVMSGRVLASDDIRPKTRKLRKNCQRWSVEYHRLPAGLAVGKIKHPALKIDFRPFQVQYFASTATSKKQKPDCSNDKREYLDPLAFCLRPVLGSRRIKIGGELPIEPMLLYVAQRVR